VIPRVTEELFLKDAYLRESDARITGVELLKGSKAYIELDKTIFHPLGGGQPSDEGTILSGNMRFRVKKAIRQNRQIRHWGRIEAGEPGVGEVVKCVLDWEKRYLVMRLHTAGHILDYAMLKLYGRLVETVDAYHGPPEAYLVYKVAQPPDPAELERVANRVVEAGLAVQVKFVPRDMLEEAIYNAPNLSRLPVLEEYRIVEIEGVNSMPCSGTHVKNTLEVGFIRITSMVSEIGGIRVGYCVQ
jgi:alanyl-tRNA synthetase